MDTIDALIERAGALKGELVDFGLSKRFRRAYDAALDQYPSAGGLNEERWQQLDPLRTVVLSHLAGLAGRRADPAQVEGGCATTQSPRRCCVACLPS